MVLHLAQQGSAVDRQRIGDDSPDAVHPDHEDASSHLRNKLQAEEPHTAWVLVVVGAAFPVDGGGAAAAEIVKAPKIETVRQHPVVSDEPMNLLQNLVQATVPHFHVPSPFAEHVVVAAVACEACAADPYHTYSGSEIEDSSYASCLKIKMKP